MASRPKTSNQKQNTRKRSGNPPAQSSSGKPNMIMIAVIAVVAIAVIAAAVFFLMNQNPADETDDQPGEDGYTTNNPVAVIETSMGEIRVELYEDKVPNTVDNFIKLANDDFYEGLVFHRIIDDFMIQGGGFEADGSRKESPYGTIDLEINENVRHVDGAISMARTNEPNSATSQFFICDGAQTHLDDNYAAFGAVIEGMEVVRDIAALETTSKNGMQNWPVDDVLITSITIENN